MPIDKKNLAQVSDNYLRRIFSVPEGGRSSLIGIEKDIAKNLIGFLKEHLIAGDLSPQEIEKTFQNSCIPEEPIFVSEQADFLLKHVVSQSVHTSSPSFIGHMTSALPYFMLPLGKIMMALNQNLVKMETSKAFTPLERQVVAMLHRLVYKYPDNYYKKFSQSRQFALGVLSTGGTTANIAAMWVARNQLLGCDKKSRFPGIQKVGFFAAMAHYHFKQLVIIASKRIHYSFYKAADILGLGKEHVLTVEVDHQHKISIAALAKKIYECQSTGQTIMAIVGIAGTTETGHVDPLEEMETLSRKAGSYFHVDAAWGGPTLLSSKHREKLAGIAKADSVTIDAHKQLYVPIGCGGVLFRDKRVLHEIQQTAEYVLREGSRDLGKYTLEGSRSGMAMLIHSSLRVFGRRGFEHLIDHNFAKTKKFAHYLQQTEFFELTTPPELNILTYRFCPKIIQKQLKYKKYSSSERTQLNRQLNNINEDIQKTQRSQGKSFVSRTRIELQQHNNDMCTVLRVVLANPLTEEKHLRAVLEEQEQIAQSLLSTKYKKTFLNKECRSPKF